jgi:hypothetical protein
MPAWASNALDDRRRGGADPRVRAHDRADAIDAAYHAKFGRRYPTIVPPIVAADARAATLKLVPRSDT